MVFTTTIRVPRRFASIKYFIETGWLLLRLVPMSRMRSVPMRSLSEQVGAATPMVRDNPATVAAWQRRAQRSTWLVPSRRAALVKA